MFWASSFLAAVFSTLAQPGFAVEEVTLQEQESTEGIRVEAVGALRIRFARATKKKQLRTARIYTSEGRLDLAWRPEQKESIAGMANGKIRVKGSLMRRKGPRDRPAWIIEVDELNAIGPEMPWPEITKTFESITISRSGGFAGMMERQTVTADGKVITRSLEDDAVTSESQLDHEILMQLHELAGATNWKRVPREQKNARPIPDQMNVAIVIETRGGTYEFEFDSPGGDNIKPLNDLIQLAGGEEP